MTVNIQNNQIAFWALTLTASGVVVPTPPADAFSVVSSGPASLQATIGVDPGGSGATGVIGTPLVMESDSGNSGGGFTLTVTDSDGDVTDILGPCNITVIPVVPVITAGQPTFSPNPSPPTAAGP